MKAVSLNSSEHLGATPRPGLLDGMARRIVLDRLKDLEDGRLAITEGQDRYFFGNMSPGEKLTAAVTVNDARFYGDVAFGGSIGAGESWMQGHWDCNDLVSLVRIMVRNRDLRSWLYPRLARADKDAHCRDSGPPRDASACSGHTAWPRKSQRKTATS